MTPHKILFLHPMPMPGTYQSESLFTVKPEWVAMEERYGILIEVPGKGAFLYPWSTIKRVEYADASRGLTVVAVDRAEEGHKAVKPNGCLLCGKDDCNGHDVSLAPKRGPGRPRKEA